VAKYKSIQKVATQQDIQNIEIKKPDKYEKPEVYKVKEVEMTKIKNQSISDLTMKLNNNVN
jgi:hypothetical protein